MSGLYTSNSDMTARHITFIKSESTQVENYSCNFCSEHYNSETEVELHKESCHLDEVQSRSYHVSDSFCLICLKKYKNNDALDRHFKTIHLLSSPTAVKVEREIFVCHYCRQLFFNKKMLSVHIIRNHRLTEKKVSHLECPKCNKKVKINTVWSHFSNFHQMGSVACCPICFTKCKDRKELLTHTKAHMRYYTCELCNYTTEKEIFYKQHFDEKHKFRELDNLKLLKMNYINVSKYFIPRKRTANTWSYPKSFGIKGLILQNDYYICIMCRHIARSDADMEYHVATHGPRAASAGQKARACACGEHFFNNVLMKHHIFKANNYLKHYDPNNPPTIKPQTLVVEDSTVERLDNNEEEERMEDDELTCVYYPCSDESGEDEPAVGQSVDITEPAKANIDISVGSIVTTADLNTADIQAVYIKGSDIGSDSQTIYIKSGDPQTTYIESADIQGAEIVFAERPIHVMSEADAEVIIGDTDTIVVGEEENNGGSDHSEVSDSDK